MTNLTTNVLTYGSPERAVTVCNLQLRIDEARKLVTVAMEHASALDVSSPAAVMQIFLGLRSTEAVVRVVRDLDDEGRVLWVPFGKTQNAKLAGLLRKTLSDSVAAASWGRRNSVAR